MSKKGEIACKSEDGASCSINNDMDSCKQAITDNSTTSFYMCGQQHRGDFNCTEYDNCGRNDDSIRVAEIANFLPRQRVLVF